MLKHNLISQGKSNRDFARRFRHQRKNIKGKFPRNV